MGSAIQTVGRENLGDGRASQIFSEADQRSEQNPEAVGGVPRDQARSSINGGRSVHSTSPELISEAAIACQAPTVHKPVPVLPITNDQTDTPTESCGADLVAVHPRFFLRGRKASRARLTMSLSDKPLLPAYERRRSTNASESFTVNAIFTSSIGTSCFNRPAC